jgi:short-subunit dehydrogenase
LAQKSFPFAAGVAVVTGAGSGIGAALADSLAERGAALALVDIDGSRLEQVAARLRARSIRVTSHCLDVAEKDAVAALAASIEGPVNLLVNNAGVALGGRFEQVTAEDFDWLMSINFSAAVRLIRAFLPRLRQAPEARIVNVSSVFGIIAPPGQAAYAASKFALRGFSEALRAELSDSHVGVSVVHPGGVRTSIAANARSVPMSEAERAEAAKRWEKALRMPPAEAGERIAKGIERRQARILVGTDAHVIDWMQRLFPVAHAAIVRRLIAA